MLLSWLNIREIHGKPRNFGLDLVRAIAITLVLIAHGRALLPDFPEREWFAIGGFLGVELFFVLSGFLVGGILLRAFAAMGESSASQVVTSFLIRRWFRTLPNYFLFLLLNITLFQWLFGEKAWNAGYLLFLQNFAWPSPPLMPESWSLAVEEWFYLSFALLLGTVAGLIRSGKSAILLAILVYILFFTVLRFFFTESADVAWGAGVRRVVIFRLDAIGYGVLIAFLEFYYARSLARFVKPLLILGCLLVAASVVLYYYGQQVGRDGVMQKTVLFSLASGGLALLLPWFKELRAANGRLYHGVAYVSVTSYSMYLIHFSFSIPLFSALMPDGNLLWYVYYPLYLALTFFLSVLVYRYYEKPATDLRERFSVENKKTKA